MGKTFLIIIGPPAVGKMSVGQEISALTGLKLFHNHQSIDAVSTVFDFGSPEFSSLVHEFRTRVFEEAAYSPSLDGLIFTCVRNFKNPFNIRALDEWAHIFKDSGGKVYLLELLSSLETRLQRNECESRIIAKPSKRDLAKSREILLANERDWDMKAPDGYSFHDGFLSLNTDNLSAEDAARITIKKFSL